MRAVLAILWLCLAAPAWSGPWPRAPGETFASVGGVASPLRAEALVYVERGLGRGWTVALDAAAGRAGGGRTLVLVSRALSPPAALLRWSVEAGGGQYVDAAGTAKGVLRFGLAAGRGWGGRRPGWVRADVLAETRNGALAVKTDAQLGLAATRRLRAILGLEGDWGAAGAGTLFAAPSVVWTIRKGFDLELGGKLGVVGSGEAGLRLVTWIVF